MSRGAASRANPSATFGLPTGGLDGVRPQNPGNGGARNDKAAQQQQQQQ